MTDDDLARFTVEWSGSSKIRANGSENTVSPSSKVTPCFFRFSLAFLESHSNSKRIGQARGYHGQFVPATLPDGLTSIDWTDNRRATEAANTRGHASPASRILAFGDVYPRR